MLLLIFDHECVVDVADAGGVIDHLVVVAVVSHKEDVDDVKISEHVAAKYSCL